MTIENGYWIYMNSPDVLELSGMVPTSTTINVSQGWNRVGYYYPEYHRRAVLNKLFSRVRMDRRRLEGFHGTCTIRWAERDETLLRVLDLCQCGRELRGSSVGIYDVGN